jgi:NAD(P)-dependent dehydrogenase (short-subunit alcohol dehydrogenase family)
MGAAVNRVVDRAFTEYGELDLLFNNAGIGIGGNVEDLALAHWERILDVNVRGVILGIQAAYLGWLLAAKVTSSTPRAGPAYGRARCWPPTQ